VLIFLSGFPATRNEPEIQDSAFCAACGTDYPEFIKVFRAMQEKNE
jgi:hypothetical protein